MTQKASSIFLKMIVMAGLVPAIHALLAQLQQGRGCPAAQTSVRSLRKADYYGRA
jgi:hypothetical protein